MTETGEVVDAQLSGRPVIKPVLNRMLKRGKPKAMTQLQTPPLAPAPQLDPDASAKLLHRAAMRQAAISLGSAAMTEQESVAGSLVAVDSSTLTAELHSPTQRDTDELAEGPLCGTLRIDTERYFFETKCLEIRREGPKTTLVLQRPDGIRFLQRRRTPRYRLQEEATVVLEREENDFQPPIEAALLNLSDDGLACRISTEMAEGIQIEEELQVRFSLPSGREGFDVRGRVTNLTPAGTPGHVVLGMEFVFDQDGPDVQQGLKEAMGNAGRS